MIRYWVRTRYYHGDIRGEGWVFDTRQEAEHWVLHLKGWRETVRVRCSIRIEEESIPA